MFEIPQSLCSFGMTRLGVYVENGGGGPVSSEVRNLYPAAAASFLLFGK
jgi:hypothetical protein